MVLPQDQAQASQASNIIAEREYRAKLAQYEQDKKKYEKELEEYNKEVARLKKIEADKKAAEEAKRRAEEAARQAQIKAAQEAQAKRDAEWNRIRLRVEWETRYLSGGAKNRAMAEAKFKFEGGSDQAWRDLRAQENRDRANSQRQSASLRAAGNAQIQAAQRTELQRLGGSGSLQSGSHGATSVSGNIGQTRAPTALDSSGNVSVAAIAQPWTALFVPQAPTAPVKNDPVSNWNQVADPTATGFRDVEKPTQPIPYAPQKVHARNQIAPALIPASQRSNVGYAPDGSPYEGPGIPQGRVTVTVGDDTRTFKDYSTAQKFVERYGKNTRNVITPIGLTEFAKSQGPQLLWEVDTKQGKRQFASEQEANTFIQSEYDKRPYTDAKILPLESLYAMVDKSAKANQKLAEERPNEVIPQIMSAGSSFQAGLLNAVTMGGDAIDKYILKRPVIEKKQVTMAPTYYDKGFESATKDIKITSEAPYISGVPSFNPFEKGNVFEKAYVGVREQWEKQTPAQNIGQSIAIAPVVAFDIATIGQGGLGVVRRIGTGTGKIIGKTAVKQAKPLAVANAPAKVFGEKSPQIVAYGGQRFEKPVPNPYGKERTIPYYGRQVVDKIRSYETSLPIPGKPQAIINVQEKVKIGAFKLQEKVNRFAVNTKPKIKLPSKPQAIINVQEKVKIGAFKLQERIKTGYNKGVDYITRLSLPTRNRPLPGYKLKLSTQMFVRKQTKAYQQNKLLFRRKVSDFKTNIRKEMDFPNRTIISGSGSGFPNLYRPVKYPQGLKDIKYKIQLAGQDTKTFGRQVVRSGRVEIGKAKIRKDIFILKQKESIRNTRDSMGKVWFGEKQTKAVVPFKSKAELRNTLRKDPDDAGQLDFISKASRKGRITESVKHAIDDFPLEKKRISVGERKNQRHVDFVKGIKERAQARTTQKIRTASEYRDELRKFGKIRIGDKSGILRPTKTSLKSIAPGRPDLTKVPKKKTGFIGPRPIVDLPPRKLGVATKYSKKENILDDIQKTQRERMLKRKKNASTPSIGDTSSKLYKGDPKWISGSKFTRFKPKEKLQKEVGFDAVPTKSDLKRRIPRKTTAKELKFELDKDVVPDYPRTWISRAKASVQAPKLKEEFPIRKNLGVATKYPKKDTVLNDIQKLQKQRMKERNIMSKDSTPSIGDKSGILKGKVDLTSKKKIPNLRAEFGIKKKKRSDIWDEKTKSTPSDGGELTGSTGQVLLKPQKIDPVIRIKKRTSKGQPVPIGGFSSTPMPLGKAEPVKLSTLPPITKVSKEKLKTIPTLKENQLQSIKQSTKTSITTKQSTKTGTTTKTSEKLSTGLATATVSITGTKVKPRLKEKTKLAIATALSQPAPQVPRKALRSAPRFNAIKPIARARTVDPIPKKRRVVAGLLPPLEFDGEKKKKKRYDEKTNEFLGNTRLDKIEGLFRRSDIIHGDRRIQKQIRKDKKAKFKEKGVKFFSSK